MGLTNIHVDRANGALTVTWSLSCSHEKAWAHLQEPTTMNEWLGRPTKVDAWVGGEIIVDHGDDSLCRSEILSCSDAESVELTWEFPAEQPSRLSLRTFEPRPPADGSPLTTLALRHSELGVLVDSYANGWLTHLTYFEASLTKATLPWNQFWNLCRTFEKLRSAKQTLDGR